MIPKAEEAQEGHHSYGNSLVYFHFRGLSLIMILHNKNILLLHSRFYLPIWRGRLMRSNRTRTLGSARRK